MQPQIQRLESAYLAGLPVRKASGRSSKTFEARRAFRPPQKIRCLASYGALVLAASTHFSVAYSQGCHPGGPMSMWIKLMMADDEGARS
jgi:hypothetical protein